MEPAVGQQPAESDGLADRLKCGDREALAAIFSQHRERLWRMVNFRMDRRLLGRVDAGRRAAGSLYGGRRAAATLWPATSLSPFVWLRMVRPANPDRRAPASPGRRMRDADREVDLRGCRYPISTSVSLAAQLVGTLTSPSQAAARAETLDQVEQAIAPWTRWTAKSWPCGISRSWATARWPRCWGSSRKPPAFATCGP